MAPTRFRMTRSIVVVLVALLALAAGVGASAADCDGRQAVGYRVLALPSGRKLAVWYPAAATEQPFAYTRAGGGLMGSVARDAPPAACPRVPLVLFSHGLGGCGLQSTFLTEELARRGYVVAAPDHADAATCGIDGEALRLQNLRTEQPLLEPARWTEQSEIGRLNDLRAAIHQVGRDAALARIADTKGIGVVGHSLGGYAALAIGGAWPTWRTPEVKAVVALSPFVTPFIAHGTLSKLAVPVMYQGAEFDWGITPNMEGPRGAFAMSPAPKYYVRLRGGTHVEWTNLGCLGVATAAACLQARPNAALIGRYVAEFLDRYLKDLPSPLLASEGRGLEAYRFEVR
ncbi:MAG TPA: dienelactone hydrolase family protein [Burkholderiaceae bacterium]|nr:dienelactone hydrolase family protein [Burkholderiaceae bacterium]